MTLKGIIIRSIVLGKNKFGGPMPPSSWRCFTASNKFLQGHCHIGELLCLWNLDACFGICPKVYASLDLKSEAPSYLLDEPVFDPFHSSF